MNRKVALGIYRLADPKISITSVASMTIGASVAATEAPLDWVWLLMLGIAMFCMEVAKNAWGDVYDYDSGTDLAVAPEDKTDFSGGKRVMVDQLLSRQQTWLIAFLFGAAGLMIGALIVFMREPQVFWIGMAGLILGWSYHGPPLQLVYRGLGEIAVLLIYGPVIALSTYLIQRHHWNTEVLWLSLPLGIFITAFLWVNEFPDHDADQSANKRNMVVLLGKHRASRTLPVIYLAGFALMLLLPVITTLPLAVFWGAIAVPTAMQASLWCWQNPLSFYRDKPVQPMALLTFVLYPLGVLSGLYFDGHML